MPMRFGEMVLVIRTQDYASRNLNRLASNLGKLSKLQQLQRQQQSQLARQSDLLARRDTISTDIANLRRRLDLDKQINATMRDRRALTAGMRKLERMAPSGVLRGAGGQFVSAMPFMNQAKAGMKQLEEQEGRLLRQQRALTKEIGLTSPALARLGTAASEARLGRLESELGRVSQRLKIVRGDLTITGDALNRMPWHRLHEGGQFASRLGRIMQLTGLIATGSFVAMANRAADFSASTTLAATQARNLGNNIQGQEEVLRKSARLQEAINEQMQIYPVSAQEMSNATYEIFSSLDLMNNKGIVNVSKGLGILEIANKAAVAGGVSLDDSMKGLIITLNNFDSDLNEVTPTLDTMFDIVRFGNIHFSDLTNIMSKVAPAAKAVGLSLEDVSGAVAQATRTLPVGTVSAGFSQLLATFSDRSFQEGLRIASKARLGRVIDIQEAGQLKAPLEILRDILTIFPELGKGGLETKRFFKLVTGLGTKALTGKDTVGREFTIQQRRVFETLVQNFGSVEELQAAIMANNGELGKSFAVMMKDPGIQWKVFLSQMQALVLTIGTLALPAILSLVSWIQRLVKWFQNLDPATQSIIVRIGVFGSALFLLAGVVASLGGAIASMIGSLGLISKGMGPLMMLARSVAFLAGIGAIALIMKVAITGDMSVWEFIQGAMLGAAAGSMFGPAGAVLGGIIVPVTLLMLKEGQKTPQEQAFEDFQKGMKGVQGQIARHGRVGIPGTGLDVPLPFKPQFDKEDFDRQWAFLVRTAKGNKLPWEQMDIDPRVRELFRKYKDDIVGLKKPTKDVADQVRELLSGTKNKTLQKELDRLLKTVPELEGMFGDSKRATDEWSRGLAQAVSQATEQAEQSIDQAAANMTNTWMQFRDQNAQMFGELFSGPFFQSETWSLAEEWDIKPSMKEINRDLREQIAQFKKYRGTISAIGKRKGATPELMKELTALGPGAMKFLEVLRSGAPGAWNQFIRLWRTKQREIERATQIDFDKQLAQWFKYGKGIAQQIILGLRSENVNLDNGFRKYITDKFPNIVRDAQAEAVAAYKAANPKPPKQGGTGTGTGGNNNNSNNNNANVTVIVYPREGETTLHALKRGAWEYAHRGSISGHGEHKGPPPKGSKVIVDKPGGNAPRKGRGGPS